MGRRDTQSGVVLINVLVTLALASTVLYAMISLSELSIARSQRYSEAGQAQALIAAAEASLISALSRDMAEAPGSDNLTEGWAQIAQQPVSIAGGSFALVVEDAQSRINLNSEAMRGAQGAQTLRRIGEALDLPADVTDRIRARLAQRKPLERLDDLIADAGLSPAELVALRPFLTVLPRSTDVNLNTASEEVIGVLTGNLAQTASLVAIRARNGSLAPQDVERAQMIPPPGIGFTSAWFRAIATVRVGTTTQQVSSLIQRSASADGQRHVGVVARETPFRGSVQGP
ncbi:type II secretion system protein GspK [Paracoccus sp. WLY502]|uniref:general secretion pathway protein GspK n=1 Tax=Paracoccus yibinensis TaxID=3068891 RepID=UPI002796AFC7|nr:type II secretion system protein GspK [Paracoccus sp. WLY502]MDQ1901659.1 type II secretion system protein GspK [Paracoccus sp. WLY502]